MRKLMKKLHKSLLKPKKTSESEPSSSSFSSSYGSTTPTSVLPAHYELKQAFRMIDSDGDGKITNLELHTFLARLGGGSDDDLGGLMEDGHRSCITLEEFCSSAFAPPACDSEVRDTFEFFDSDDDGRITAEELHQVFRAINGDTCTLEDCKRMIGGADRNGDGFVYFEDFRTMILMEDITNHVR